MKMKSTLAKRLSALLLITLFVSLVGCGNGKTPAPESVSTEEKKTEQTEQIEPATAPEPGQPEETDVMKIVDRDGNELGAIAKDAICSAADGGVFYSLFAPDDESPTGTAEYRFFDKTDKNNILLGTLENQGYEAIFTRTEAGGKIYTLAVTGDLFDDRQDTLLLLSFDPEAGGMKRYVVSEFGFPYAAMAASDGKLLIMNHEMSEPRCDKLYEFDPETETIKEVLQFPGYDDSLRGVSAGEDGFYLLRLHFGDGETVTYIDKYDGDYNKISETAMNDVLVDAIKDVHGIVDRQDVLNELGMMASRFFVEDGRFMIYENFGLVRLILDLETGEALFARDDYYSVSVGSGSPVVYSVDFDGDPGEGREIVGMENGKLTRYDFEPVGDEKLIEQISRSKGGTWCVLVGDSVPVTVGSAVLYLWTE